jgi:hypothetical protein
MEETDSMRVEKKGGGKLSGTETALRSGAQDDRNKFAFALPCGRYLLYAAAGIFREIIREIPGRSMVTP